MGEADPIQNFRAPQEVKDAISLLAKRSGKDVGPMIRDWCKERIAVDRVLELLKAVDLPEVLRRLSTPSSLMMELTAETISAIGQTSENFVKQDSDLVLQTQDCSSSVLRGKHSKRG